VDRATGPGARFREHPPSRARTSGVGVRTSWGTGSPRANVVPKGLADQRRSAEEYPRDVIDHRYSGDRPPPNAGRFDGNSVAAACRGRDRDDPRAGGWPGRCGHDPQH
jgi:hypothetical protein